MQHLKRPVALTRFGMMAEQVVRAFWPLWSVIFVGLAPILFGWHETMSLEGLWTFFVVVFLALVGALVWGIRQFKWPSRQEAVDKVDAALPGRPIAAVADSQAIGSGDAASEAVWQAHMARMAERTKDAAAVEPDLRVADRDPYGLRFIALLFFVCALTFGSLFRITTVGESLSTDGPNLAAGPVWEGWVTPPAYTGKPTLYLNDIPPGPLPVPVGSEIALRLYGEVGALTVAETVSGRTEDLGAASDAQQEFVVAQSGEIAIEGENGAAWAVNVIEDQPPFVELTGPIEADALGEMSQPFRAEDDYGVVSGTAEIALDLGAVDRRHGLAIAPEARGPVVIDLPMPFSGDRSDFEELLIDDFSEHPFANLPVTITLSVQDEAEQMGVTEPERIILPGRRFFQPFARAIIEQRRDLLWSKDNGKRVVQIMKAIAHRPEGLFSNEVTFLRMRAITRRLDTFVENGFTDENRDEIVQALWDLAIQLEEGTLADARERLRRAQERLSEAMRNGASDEEIAELMNELREATNEYMQMLADQMDPNQNNTDQPQTSENSMEFTQDELQALMDRIEELMQEGRMAEAQQLMEQLNQLMENLQITQGQGGEGGPLTPGQQSMQDLADTLREQEELSDDAFRDLQEETNRGQQGQQGQQQSGQQPGQQQGREQGQLQPGQQNGQTGSGQEGEAGDQFGQQNQNGEGQGSGRADNSGQGGDEQSLADRQQALRDELERQQRVLPNLEGEAGEFARRSLEQAEGAMDGAEEALREGDLAEAIDRQAEAMNALRNGMRSLREALAQNENTEPGQGNQQGDATGRTQPNRTDPLGREVGNSGQFGTDENLLNGEDVYRRADELLGEIRRRSGEQSRPEVERDYLKRLLDRF
ncbi:TIGR02302 family protein [Cognatiyoonia sediminum]|uniref:TIGR02302 family protein n=1 Tax=Cognatiyoonia sediminum TaxID=1508389 RepID=A0A1M5PU73_9RHOB|nr:DUF4175 domain-containing protein [Cognatiyoonia sediminum]SHH05405.1 TIGR02302 family protein [Cognatiyoonia sediminum]